ncbi:hypothetical protein [Streptomyces hirsutus]|uniref:hypothetical protein n=1 Tax=Streptomyces hirsutus TaxID=35620 RepID=UPI000B3156B5|nr:hypothetical protein [Streptomyces hirsutus]
MRTGMRQGPEIWIRGPVGVPEPGPPEPAHVHAPARRFSWVGTHGGAGVSTLAAVHGGHDSGRAWPGPGDHLSGGDVQFRPLVPPLAHHLVHAATVDGGFGLFVLAHVGPSRSAARPGQVFSGPRSSAPVSLTRRPVGLVRRRAQ